MNRLVPIAAVVAITSLGAGTALAQGGRHGSRDDDRYRPRHQERDRHDDRRRGRDGRAGQAYEVASSLESRVDRFARSFDHALDRSRLNGSRREDRLNEHAKRLERQTDQLKDRLRHRRGGARELVDRIFEEARVLDRFIARARLHRQAEQDWRGVKRDLDRLARQYRVARWDGRHDNCRERGRDRYERGRDRDGRGWDCDDRRRRSRG